MSREKRHEEHTPRPHKDTAAQASPGQLQAELQRAKEQYLRVLAEVDNTRKRLQRDKEEFAKYAAETMVRELLPIVDSLDQALVAVDKQADPQAVIKGIHLIYRQLLGLLEKEGVKRISTIGERFDPHRHEAVAQVDPMDGQADNTIAEEVQVGYTMHGKVIRPAMVKVTRTPSADSTQQTADSGQQAADSTRQAAVSNQQSAEKRSGLGAEGSGQVPGAQHPEP